MACKIPLVAMIELLLADVTLVTRFRQLTQLRVEPKPCYERLANRRNQVPLTSR
jgi:hypothetical protein